MKHKAMIFAMKAHSDQVRKYTAAPYVQHCAELIDILEKYTLNPVSEEMYCAAWLHDVVEDTDHTLDDIRIEFGDIVAKYVYYLTDASKSSDGNRRIRKAIDREHISSAPAEAKTVKLADLISNSKSILMYDPNFARVYIKEKKRLLEVLKEGDPFLFAIASTIVEENS